MNQDELKKAIQSNINQLCYAKTEFDKLYARYKIQNYTERLKRLENENRYSEEKESEAEK